MNFINGLWHIASGSHSEAQACFKEIDSENLMDPILDQAQYMFFYSKYLESSRQSSSDFKLYNFLDSIFKYKPSQENFNLQLRTMRFVSLMKNKTYLKQIN